MEKCKMKNVVVLKNLPSNLIEEAFIVVKYRKVARSLEYIDTKNGKFDSDCKDDGYIVREAESVLSSYASLIAKKADKKGDITWKRKCKKLAIFNIIVSIGFVISIFI